MLDFFKIILKRDLEIHMVGFNDFMTFPVLGFSKICDSKSGKGFF